MVWSLALSPDDAKQDPTRCLFIFYCQQQLRFMYLPCEVHYYLHHRNYLKKRSERHGQIYREEIAVKRHEKSNNSMAKHTITEEEDTSYY